jgi:hypothetical protein
VTVLISEACGEELEYEIECIRNAKGRSAFPLMGEWVYPCDKDKDKVGRCFRILDDDGMDFANPGYVRVELPQW